jgi:hypothetical protein
LPDSIANLLGERIRAVKLKIDPEWSTPFIQHPIDPEIQFCHELGPHPEASFS